MRNDRIEPPRVDLSALDFSADSIQWEQLVAAITVRAAPELARRRAPRSPVLVLARWARPALSAAAAVILVASIALAALAPESAAEERAVPALVATLGVPTPVARWVVENRTPTATDLISAFAGRSQ